MTVEDNKQLVRSFYDEAINGRDTYACERLLAKGFVHNGVKRGREGQREAVAYLLAAFQPLRHEILLLLAEQDLVAAGVMSASSSAALPVGATSCSRRRRC
jgi:predicted ester cyclase